MADVGPIRGRRFGRIYRRFELHAPVRHKRLLIAGLCRCLGPDWTDPVRAAVETLEAVADGRAPEAALKRVIPAQARGPANAPAARVHRAVSTAIQAARARFPNVWQPFVDVRVAADNVHLADPTRPSPDEMRGRLTRVLLDLSVAALGPISFDPRWRTADVVGLARGIYEERAFDRMPILADALMDAGCERARIIDHCREPGPHYRGCWVVDAVLGLG